MNRDWNEIVEMMESGKKKEDIWEYKSITHCELCAIYGHVSLKGKTHCCEPLSPPKHPVKIKYCPLDKAGQNCDEVYNSWWNIFTTWIYGMGQRSRALVAAIKIRDCVNKYNEKKEE